MSLQDHLGKLLAGATIILGVVVSNVGCARPNMATMDPYIYDRRREDIVWLEATDSTVAVLSRVIPSPKVCFLVAVSRPSHRNGEKSYSLEVTFVAYPESRATKLDILPQYIRVLYNGQDVRLVGSAVRRSGRPVIEIWSTAVFSDTLLPFDWTPSSGTSGQEVTVLLDSSVIIDGAPCRLEPILGHFDLVGE